MPHKDESEQPKPNGVTRRQFITRTAAGAVGAVALTSVLEACGGSSSGAAPTAAGVQNITASAWKFGVMADTQWTNPPGDDGYNPNTSAVAIASQIQQQFINNKVAFVVHVGDFCDNANMSTTSGSPSPGGVLVETGSNAGTVTDSSTWTTSATAPDPSTVPAVAGEDTRALYVQALYNAGIGFFPVRGNHDDDQPPNGATGALIAKEIARLYPQTQNGQHNATPADIFNAFATGDYWVPKDTGNPFAAKTGSAFTLGSNFSSPDPWSDGGLKGLSYSFDYNNVRCILLDQFVPSTNNSNYSMATTVGAQQPWISSQLAGRASGSHAIVFAHKGLLTCNHADNLFTPASGANASPAYNATQQNAFFTSLASNGVRLYLNGHDHMYDRSIVTSPDGTSSVMQIVAQSDSSKFYPPQGSNSNTTTVPLGSSNDLYFNNNATAATAPKYVNGAVPAGVVSRRQAVSQELFTVGYYIFTVNGPLVTVDYYAATVYPYPIDTSEQIINTTPGLNFVKRETFGYSLNGKQFIVAQGSSYSVVQDSSSGGTSAAILGGSNNSKAQDACGLACVKAVNTGWISASGSVSDILMLWGINPYTPSAQADMSSYPDTYPLSMKVPSERLTSSFAICTQDANGNWTNAVNLNSGGTKNAVAGPWNSSYGLGTYGYDQTTNSVWAVLNYTALFAIATPVS